MSMPFRDYQVQAVTAAKQRISSNDTPYWKCSDFVCLNVHTQPTLPNRLLPVFLVVLWCWILLNITLKCCNFPRFMSANVRRIVQSTVFQTSKMFAFWSVLVLNYFRFPRFFITLNISGDTTFSIRCIIRWSSAVRACTWYSLNGILMYQYSWPN